MKSICQVGILQRGRRDSHSLVFFCSARASGSRELRGAMLASRGVPGGCYYLEVGVLSGSFPYILVFPVLPYPWWVGTYVRYPSRVG
jgi:hypothetical protein